MARPNRLNAKQATINFSGELYEKIKRDATQEGISISEYIRRILYRMYANEDDTGAVDRIIEKISMLRKEKAEYQAKISEIESKEELLKKELERARARDNAWEEFQKADKKYASIYNKIADTILKWAMNNRISPGSVDSKVLRGIVNQDTRLLVECQELFGRKPSQCLDVVWSYDSGRLKDEYKL